MTNRTITAIALVAILAVAAVGAGFAYSAMTSNTGNQTDNDWVTVGIFNENTGVTYKGGSDPIMDTTVVHFNTVTTPAGAKTWTVAAADGSEVPQELTDGATYIALTDSKNAEDTVNYDLYIRGMESYVTTGTSGHLSIKGYLFDASGTGAALYTATADEYGVLKFTNVVENTVNKTYKLSITIEGTTDVNPVNLQTATLTFLAMPTTTAQSSIVTITGSGTVSGSVTGSITDGNSASTGETITITVDSSAKVTVVCAGKNILDQATGGTTYTFVMPSAAVTITIA